MMKKKMTMKQFEKSAMDKKADKKSGAAEGSKADTAQDNRDMKKMNKPRSKGC